MNSLKPTPFQILVVLFNLAVIAMVYNSDRREPRPSAPSCEAQMRLLLANTDPASGLSVRGERRPHKRDSERPFSWTVVVSSKDGSFRQVFTGPDLCPLLDTAWGKLDVYNSYVDDSRTGK